MSHFGDCIKDLEDKPNAFFKAVEVDVSDFVNKVQVQLKNLDGHVLMDNDGN